MESQSEKQVMKKSTSSRGFWVWITLLVVSIVGGILVFTFTFPTESPKRPPSKQERTSSRKLRRESVKTSGTASDVVRRAMPKDFPSHKRARDEKPVEIFSHLTGVDRRFAEAVQTALDNDDFKATVEAVQKAMTSTNVEVRINAVEALAWFGTEALPELTACMTDADEEVRQVAESEWELAIQGIDALDTRFRIVTLAFSKLVDKDQLSSFGGLMDSAATEWIDSAERKEIEDERRFEVVQALVDIIEGENKKTAEAACEIYESVTGSEWKGIDEAERYLADPENYDPDEAPIVGGTASEVSHSQDGEQTE